MCGFWIIIRITGLRRIACQLNMYNFQNHKCFNRFIIRKDRLSIVLLMIRAHHSFFNSNIKRLYRMFTAATLPFLKPMPDCSFGSHHCIYSVYQFWFARSGFFSTMSTAAYDSISHDMGRSVQRHLVSLRYGSLSTAQLDLLARSGSHDLVRTIWFARSGSLSTAGSGSFSTAGSGPPHNVQQSNISSTVFVQPVFV